MPKIPVSTMMRSAICETYVSMALASTNKEVYEQIKETFGGKGPGFRILSEQLTEHRQHLNLLMKEPTVLPLSSGWPMDPDAVDYLSRIDNVARLGDERTVGLGLSWDLAESPIRWTKDSIGAALQLRKLFERTGMLEQQRSNNFVDVAHLDLSRPGHIGASINLVRYIVEEVGNRRLIARAENEKNDTAIEPGFRDIYLHLQSFAESNSKEPSKKSTPKYPLLSVAVHGFGSLVGDPITLKAHQAQEMMHEYVQNLENLQDLIYNPANRFDEDEHPFVISHEDYIKFKKEDQEEELDGLKWIFSNFRQIAAQLYRDAQEAFDSFLPQNLYTKNAQPSLAINHVVSLKGWLEGYYEELVSRTSDSLDVSQTLQEFLQRSKPEDYPYLDASGPLPPNIVEILKQKAKTTEIC